MARLRVESAPEFVVYDESAVIKAAANASANLLELKNSSNTTVASVSTARKRFRKWRLNDKWYRDWETDRKSTRLNSSHLKLSRMPSSA